MPIPLSRMEMSQSLPICSAETWTRGQASPVKLQRVADDVLKHQAELRAVSHYHGQGIVGNNNRSSQSVGEKGLPCELTRE